MEATKERTGQCPSRTETHIHSAPVAKPKGFTTGSALVGSKSGFLRVPWRASSKNDESGVNATGASWFRPSGRKVNARGCGAAKAATVRYWATSIQEGTARSAETFDWCELRPYRGRIAPTARRATPSDWRSGPACCQVCKRNHAGELGSGGMGAQTDRATESF